MRLNAIREEYLSFFAQRAHLREKSFPLIPLNDPGILLINAGMTPLKPYFTGTLSPPSPRMVTCQKCIRTPDIELVGKTARHGTFFEMLGNFSFGDYFKEQAITWAWEFVTQVMHMPIDKLWVSIYTDDDQAADIWINKAGLSPDRIVRLGKDDNFWEHGTGPCGPCSEIYYDRGPNTGCGTPDCKVGCDCDRFVEFWNLVFTQFDKDEEGNYNKLDKPNIDTGMGLERIAAIMQGVNSIFEVDSIKSIMDQVSSMSGVAYGQDPTKDISLRIITDHIRSCVFLIGDGVLPSNEGRGYVLRRLLRRACRHGLLLNIPGPFLPILCRQVINVNAEAYPDIADKSQYIERVIKNEQLRFMETINSGASLLKSLIQNLKDENNHTLSGQDAFKLYDTYGFPLELTAEILQEQGMTVSTEQFYDLMQKQRERARANRGKLSASAFDTTAFSKKVTATQFVGYNQYETDGSIIALSPDSDKLSEGQDGIIVCDKTVFYAASGGQAADIGFLLSDTGKAKVTDVKKHGDVILHCVHITDGEIFDGQQCHMTIDVNQRRMTACNHTATHLLQAALRKVVGEHINQAGSDVNADRLRFDFSHFEPVTPQQLEQIEDYINQTIFQSLDVQCLETSYDQAKEMGALALFSEKYGDRVRVVKVDGVSIELCGGTHVRNTAEIGVIKIMQETSVAAGVRRIEAITGPTVCRYLRQNEHLLKSASLALKVSSLTELPAKISSLLDELKDANAQLNKFKAQAAVGVAKELLSQAEKINGIQFVSAKLEGMGVARLREIGDYLRAHMDVGLAVLADVTDGKLVLTATATKSAVAKGVHSGKIIKEISALCGGSGGGRPDSATGGGQNPDLIPKALEKAKTMAIDS